jgi:methyl-accepting chemotaxis protein-1 (serine sensor receptor)
MDEVTQQNAALVEEAAAAAQSLESQAAKLRQAVAVFQLADGATHGATHGAVPAVRAAPVRAPAPKRVQPTRPAAPAPARREPVAAAPRYAAAPVAAGAGGDWETF